MTKTTFCNIASYKNKKNTTIKQLTDVNKTINKTKTNQYNLKFQPIKRQSKVAVFGDAAFGNLHDEGSQQYISYFLCQSKRKT